jgi:hypothetical protein
MLTKIRNIRNICSARRIGSMKQQFKLGLCQILTGSDKPANLERARDAVIDAAKKGAQVE